MDFKPIFIYYVKYNILNIEFFRNFKWRLTNKRRNEEKNKTLIVKTMEKNEIPRGIRNNNPLNIRRSKAKWQGLVAPSSSPEGEKAPSSSPEGGGNKQGYDAELTSGRLGSGSADSKQASVGTHYDAEFCQFESMFYGFRAAFKLLLAP